jgi:Zn-dependent peptidase ImmA (M78 family)/transcriptional regulator with XRE-family HTH domain
LTFPSICHYSKENIYRFTLKVDMVMTIETKLPNKWANPEVLKWARLRMGLKPQDVEELEKIRAEDIIQWEERQSAPTLSDLESLAEVYMCPVGYFFLEAPPAEDNALDLRGLNSRKTASLSYETHSQLEEFLRLTDYIAQLTRKTGKIRTIDIGTFNLSDPIELVAERERNSFGFTSEVRDRWNSASDAFAFWRQALENKGVYVITLKLDVSEVRGASRWDESHPPTILVNRQDNEAATGRCFTLLHEWAHLLMKHPGLVCDFQGQKNNINIESYANKFAAELLAPKNEFSGFLKQENLFEFRERWGDSTIDKIRHKFKVSKDVVAILLEEIDLAPQGFYWNKRAGWDTLTPFFRSKPGVSHGQTKAMRKLGEIGSPFASLISESYGRGMISKLELADLLNMKVEQAEQFAKCPLK